MARIWYYKIGSQTHGPCTARELKQKAADGQLPTNALIRKTAQGHWVSSDRVTGLFTDLGSTSGPPPPPLSDATATAWIESSDSSALQESATDTSASNKKLCPFCAEEIAYEAVKCKHCGEFLDQELRHRELNRQRAMSAPLQRWSPGIAALLSFFVPGAGQIYKGQVIHGLLWFFLTLFGYALFIIPGITLHVCCILAAASGDPSR